MRKLGFDEIIMNIVLVIAAFALLIATSLLGYVVWHLFTGTPLPPVIQ